MKDYVWLMDLNLQWQYISPSVEKLFGYTLNELKQFPLDHLLTEKSLKSAADTFLAEMPKNLASLQTIPYEVILELECLGRNGNVSLIETTFSLIRDEDGKPVNLLCEGRDITERRLMEDKLRYEEERFRALIEHSSDIIVVVNRQEDITYINPAIERVLGFRPEERIGSRGIELVHPDDMKFLTDSFDTLISDANAPVIRGEMRLLHKDGSFITFEAVGSNLVKNRTR